MSKKKQARRQFTAEYKATVLRRHLADKVPVSDICDALDDDFDVGLLHGLSNLVVNNETAVAAENAAQIVERTCDVEVRDVDVPVMVSATGLGESSTLL